MEIFRILLHLDLVCDNRKETELGFSVCGNLHNPNLGQKNKNKLPSDDQYNTLQELKINY